MKAEQFDRYVRAQFENDAVAPPARLETAVFESLEGQQLGRKGVLGAAAVFLTLATSAALWMGTRSSADEVKAVPTAAVETVVIDEQVATESVPESAVLPVKADHSEQPTLEASTALASPTEPSTAPIRRTAEAATEAPGRAEAVEVRTVDGVSIETGATAPELQQSDKETWVLPAVVKVND